MNLEFLNKKKLKFIIFHRFGNSEDTFTFKMAPTLHLPLTLWLFWVCWAFSHHTVDTSFTF